MTRDTKDWFISAGLFIGLGLGLLTYTMIPGAIPGFLLIGFGAGLAASKIPLKK